MCEINIYWVVIMSPMMEIELLPHSVTKLPKVAVSIHLFDHLIPYSHSTPSLWSPIPQKSSLLLCSYLALPSPTSIFLKSLLSDHVYKSALLCFSFMLLLAAPFQSFVCSPFSPQPLNAGVTQASIQCSVPMFSLCIVSA